jgi:nucleoside-diphosphate-sugar epimerase
MKRIIIAGSSGMIGNEVLKLCIARDDVSEITLINRKPILNHDARIKEYIHKDFLNYDPIKEAFAHQDICFYCIGVYTGQVPKDEFNRITIDYTKAFASALKAKSPGATFCFLSGQGADRSGKSSVLFAKAKGIAENDLFHLGFPHSYTFRPGYIYPVEKRKEPNLFYSLIRPLYKPLSFIYPNIGVPSAKLAKKMVEVGFNQYEKDTLENQDIRS